SLVEIDDINRNYNFVIPRGNYETIGGFVLSRAARIPNIGETLNFNEFKVKVLRRTPNRLVRLHLYKTRV
ncbi:MAG: transporter associated domain-containing protein, partial [Nitrosopumilus sp.]